MAIQVIEIEQVEERYLVWLDWLCGLAELHDKWRRRARLGYDAGHYQRRSRSPVRCKLYATT
jgi:hypothetical protein